MTGILFQICNFLLSAEFKLHAVKFSFNLDECSIEITQNSTIHFIKFVRLTKRSQHNSILWSYLSDTIFHASLFYWRVPMQIYWNKRKCLGKSCTPTGLLWVTNIAAVHWVSSQYDSHDVMWTFSCGDFYDGSCRGRQGQQRKKYHKLSVMLFIVLMWWTIIVYEKFTWWLYHIFVLHIVVFSELYHYLFLYSLQLLSHLQNKSNHLFLHSFW